MIETGRLSRTRRCGEAVPLMAGPPATAHGHGGRMATWGVTLLAAIVLHGPVPDAVAVALRGERPSVSPRSASRGPCSASGSRWLAPARAYRRAGLYGLEDSEWLSSLGGIERVSDGSLWVFDSSNGRLVRITADLSEHRQIAGPGPGPGELSSLPGMILESMGKDWLTASDSLVYLFDGRSLNVFGVDGEFRRYVPGFRPGDVGPLNVHALHHASDLLYSVDTGRGPRADGGARRQLVTWAVRGEGREKLGGHRIPPLPRIQRGTFSPSGQADPLWEGGEGCVYVSDGERPLLMLLEPSTGRTDSVPLPEVEPPEFDADEARSDLARLMAMSDMDGAEMPEPTSVKHWAAMSVDPDGFVWLLPAAEALDYADDADAPLHVHVANPATGEVVSLTVPAFPSVFGEPGEFYSVHEDPELGVRVIRRFESRTRAPR